MERSHPLGYITKHSVRVCLETISRTVFSSLKKIKFVKHVFDEQKKNYIFSIIKNRNIIFFKNIF